LQFAEKSAKSAIVLKPSFFKSMEIKKVLMIFADFADGVSGRPVGGLREGYLKGGIWAA